ncbi:hypothetical protein [Dactylosporangium sp. NPDC049140]|uniref:hypothetical protein n=1 Tax=unclassified Dactylosporangium TaxID=2621675 RepID=UPI0033CD87C8
MSDIDLNEVRDRIKRAQRRGTPYPPDPADRVVVDREGTIRLGDQSAGEPVSVVHQATFAALDRMVRDQQTARNKLPRNTVFINETDVSGWLYSITTELGHEYTLFAYFDGTDYKVKLVAPELEGKLPAHGAHLYGSGLICLDERKGSGQATLEEAFSKSVLWALGVSYVREGFTFPFSINNEND